MAARPSKAAQPDPQSESSTSTSPDAVASATVQSPAAHAPVLQSPAAPALGAPSGPPSSLPPSILERLRRNRMGGLAAGLPVALILGPLLSVLVPDDHVLLALGILGTAIAAAVGFTVRYLTYNRSLLTQAAAFVSAAIGAHLVGATGMVNQSVSEIFELVGGQAPGWNDALLAALATPTISTGAVITGLIAAIIAGWGHVGRD